MAPSLATFVATWTVMMAAMMLPSMLPSLLLFATVTRSREQQGHRPVPSGVFFAGYLAAWAVLGLLVALGGRVVPIPDQARRVAVAAGLLIGGAYQLTPLKARCLGHCRSPMSFFMHHWGDGPIGALNLGVRHGLYCVGCCWGLMAALISLGMMRPAWMGAVALAILAEKLLPGGQRLALVFGVLLAAAGAAVLAGVLPLGPAMGGM